MRFQLGRRRRASCHRLPRPLFIPVSAIRRLLPSVYSGRVLTRFTTSSPPAATWSIRSRLHRQRRHCALRWTIIITTVTTIIIIRATTTLPATITTRKPAVTIIRTTITIISSITRRLCTIIIITIRTPWPPWQPRHRFSLYSRSWCSRRRRTVNQLVPVIETIVTLDRILSDSKREWWKD